MSNFLLSANEIEEAAGARVIGKKAASGAITSVSFDSRKVEKGGAFFCIKGEKVDAHDLIPDAISKGIVLVLGSDEEKLKKYASGATDVVFLVVKDIQKSTHKVAKAVRKKVSIPFIMITGACGKTTTKDFAASIFEKAYPTLSTPENLNNLWGVPQTMLGLRSFHKACLLEVGMNAPGEVRTLTDVIDPTIAYTTGIGESHLEFLKTVEGVLDAETEHIQWLFENKKKAIVLCNIDDPLLSNFYKEAIPKLNSSESTTYTVSSNAGGAADFQVTECKPLGLEHNFGFEFSWKTPFGKGTSVIRVPGYFNVSNALGAIGVALAAGGITTEQINEGLLHPKLTPLRAELFRSKGGAIVFNDSYNGNPMSIEAASKTAILIKNHPGSGIKRTVAILGDMLELGKESPLYHQRTGAKLNSIGIDELISVGEFASDWLNGFKGKGIAFKSKSELLSSEQKRLLGFGADTLILVKGSHGARMDEVSEALK